MSTVHEEEKTDGRYVIAGTRSLERANMLGSDVGTKLPKYRTANMRTGHSHRPQRLSVTCVQCHAAYSELSAWRGAPVRD